MQICIILIALPLSLIVFAASVHIFLLFLFSQCSFPLEGLLTFQNLYLQLATLLRVLHAGQIHVEIKNVVDFRRGDVKDALSIAGELGTVVVDDQIGTDVHDFVVLKYRNLSQREIGQTSP